MLCVQTRDACQLANAEPCWPVFSSVVIGTASRGILIPMFVSAFRDVEWHSVVAWVEGYKE